MRQFKHKMSKKNLSNDSISQINLFLLGDAGDASLELLNFLVNVFVVFHEGFLDSLQQLLVTSDALQDDSLTLFKLREEFAEVCSYKT